MPDVFSKAKRSEVMSRIRGRGNKETELTLAAQFRREGIVGWRRHVLLKVSSSRAQKAQTENRKSQIANQKSLRASSRRLLRVRPDFVFPKLKVAVFVDGCFWHGCPKHCNQPAHHRAFWRRKLEGNKERDRKVNRALRAAGWRVVRIWEHELANRPEALLRRIQVALEAGSPVSRREPEGRVRLRRSLIEAANRGLTVTRIYRNVLA